MLYPTVNDEWEEKDDLKPLIDPVKVSFCVLEMSLKLIKFITIFQRRKALEKRCKLKEKRRKSREAKKRLLLPVKDNISKIKGLVKKKNKGNNINRFGGVKGKKTGETRTSKNTKLHRDVGAKKKTKQKEI